MKIHPQLVNLTPFHLYKRRAKKEEKKRVTVVHPMVKRQQDTYYGCKDQQ